MTREEREKAIAFLKDMQECTYDELEEIRNAIKALEQQTTSFKWCTDCKEYDQEKHCCHRWSKVIRNTVEEMKQEPCEDCISRKSIKQKLQEHHDFFVNAYGGFSNLPRNDKSRVDEITNCIAMVVNEPPVQPKPKIGHWITTRTFMHDGEYYCDKCKCDSPNNEKWDYCPNCGAKMVEPQESERGKNERN